MALCLINNNNSSSKQDKLVSGTNIKTINNTSLLGDGNINTMQLVSNPVNGNILTTDANGQATDSGKKLSDLQNKLTAGSNITISSNNTISAIDTTYSAGTNVQISSSNVISATDTKYSAGTNVQISSSNVISATDTKYTANSNSPITISGTTITDTGVCKAFGEPSGIQTHILSWITNYPNYNTFMCVANSRPSNYPDAPAGEGAGYIVVSRKPDGDKNIGVTWTTLGGDVYKRVYSRSIFYNKDTGKPQWTGEWQLVGGTLNQIFRKIRYSVKSSGTPTAANAYRWEIKNIALTGFKPVNYDLVYGNSSTVTVSAEQFTDTTIGGYCSVGNHSLSVDVLYILGEAVSVSSVS